MSYFKFKVTHNGHAPSAIPYTRTRTIVCGERFRLGLTPYTAHHRDAAGAKTMVRSCPISSILANNRARLPPLTPSPPADRSYQLPTAFSGVVFLIVAATFVYHGGLTGCFSHPCGGNEGRTSERIESDPR